MTRKIDELNNLNTYTGQIDWRKFYDAMDLPEERERERVIVADKLFALFLALFVLVESVQDYEICYLYFEDGLRQIVDKYGFLDAYSTLYIERFAHDYLDVTFNRMNESDYWTSDDRAILASLNESNAIVEYDELQDAIENGCEFKIWRTENDNKVRPTHRVMEGKKIPIDEFFIVGNEQLLYPRDEVNCEDLREIASCRCHLDFE